MSARRQKTPFPFVLEELAPLRLRLKTVFGFTHVYLDDMLLFSLRDSAKRPSTNGIWVYTSIENLDNLAREFPDLPRRQLWRSGKNGWLVITSKIAGFEEHAFKLCELILQGDRRIGRVTRAYPKQKDQLSPRVELVDGVQDRVIN
jgi:hypothetical protein